MSCHHSPIAGVLVRLGFGIACALALGMCLLTIFIYVGLLIHHGDPEGAQLGALGFVAGAPLGFVIGYFVGKQKRIRRAFLASSTGAFIVGVVGGYASTIIIFASQQLGIAPPEANLASGRALPGVGLVFTFFGFGAGLFLAEHWTRLSKRDKNNTAGNTKK